MKIESKHFLFAGTAVVFIVYAAIILLLKKEYTSVMWSGMIFTAVAAGIHVFANLPSTRKDGAKSYFFNLPTTYVSTIYFIVQLAAGAFLSFTFTNLNFALVVQIIIFAASLVLILMTAGGQRTVAEIEEKHKVQGEYIRNFSAELNVLVNQCGDYDVKRKLRNLQEAARFSKPESTPATAGIENDLDDRLSAFKKCLSQNNIEEAARLADEIKGLLDARNGML